MAVLASIPENLGNLREARHEKSTQFELGEVRIGDIKLDIKSRNDIPALLIGLQYLYSQEVLRDRLFRSWTNTSFPALTERWDVRAWRCGAFW